MPLLGIREQVFKDCKLGLNVVYLHSGRFMLSAVCCMIGLLECYLAV